MPYQELSNFDIEHQLKMSQESLEFALQSANIGMWDIDLETDNVYCSKIMLKLWGIVEKDFQNQRSLMQSKVHPADLPKMREEIEASIKAESIYELDYRICPSPGIVRWVKSRGRCTYDPNTNKPMRFSGIAFDITDQKHKEEAIEEAHRAKDLFFKLASHELKNPLTCLNLHLDVREWDLKHDFEKAFTKDRVKKELQKYREQVERLAIIINKILSLGEK